MDAIMITEYVLGLTLCVYVVAAMLVWAYEFKKNALYGELQKQVKFVESLQICAALRHIKLYKITEDYRLAWRKLENAQKFVTGKVFFLARMSTPKEKFFMFR